MEIPLFDNGDRTPQPKDKIKIEDIVITPYPDRFRVYIEIKVTPFQERPNLIVAVHDEDDKIVGELNIIETMHANMEFTVHLRGVEDSAGSYSATVDLFYDTRTPPQDQKIVGFVIEPTQDEPAN